MKRAYISPVVMVVVVKTDGLMQTLSVTDAQTQSNNAAWGREDDSFWDDEE